MLGNSQGIQHRENMQNVERDDYGFKSGVGNENDEGRRKQNLQPRRHTARQIQEMESLFQECNYPSKHQIEQLRSELGITYAQVYLWFQNRRKRMRIQLNHTENAMLRAENEKLVMENWALKESLKNVICSRCKGLSSVVETMTFNTYQLEYMANSSCMGSSLTASEFVARPPLLNYSSDYGTGAISFFHRGAETLDNQTVFPLSSTNIF